MHVYESVEEGIGGTPLFRLRHLADPAGAPVYAKAEFLNVGGSVKDRAALSMIEAAERDGLLRPGGTIVEATSGNTGIGLALVGRSRGYRVIAAVADVAAAEKSDILRAYGAEVMVAPVGLPREDPAHLFNVVRRLTDEIPGAWLADQYDNPANPDAHDRTTGPEIWEQTQGRITHLVAGVGTGGTISGTAAALKRLSDGRVTVVGADPDASTYAGGDGSPYYVESIGHFVHPGTAEDLWPKSFHPEAVDRYERIPDRESLLTARRLAREEGLLAGPSSGTAVAAALRLARTLTPDDLVVVVLPDSGRSYLSKVHSDTWLRRWGFLDDPHPTGEPTVAELLAGDPAPAPQLVPLPQDLTLRQALARLTGAGAPVAPVVLPRPEYPLGLAAADVVGALYATAAASAAAADPDAPLTAHLAPPLPTVGSGQSRFEARAALADTPHPAALVVLDGRVTTLLTRTALGL